jgi:hypothetical protein
MLIPKQKSAGKYVQLSPVPPTVPVFLIGDITKNLGIFTSAILAQPQLTLSKFVLGSVEETTTGQLLQTWSDATGKPSLYIQAELESYNSLWPLWAEEMSIMLKFWEEAGKDSWSGEDYLTSKGKVCGG